VSGYELSRLPFGVLQVESPQAYPTFVAEHIYRLVCVAAKGSRYASMESIAKYLLVSAMEYHFDISCVASQLLVLGGFKLYRVQAADMTIAGMLIRSETSLDFAPLPVPWSRATDWPSDVYGWRFSNKSVRLPEGSVVWRTYELSSGSYALVSPAELCLPMLAFLLSFVESVCPLKELCGAMVTEHEMSLSILSDR
jgi:hypothetical protein